MVVLLRSTVTVVSAVVYVRCMRAKEDEAQMCVSVDEDVSEDEMR